MHPWLIPQPEPGNLIYNAPNDIPIITSETLDTRYMPSATEAEEAVVIQSGISTDLEECSRLIDYLDRAKADLHSRIDAMEKVQVEYKSVYSPVRRLPAELLGQIFVHTADWSPDPVLMALGTGVFGRSVSSADDGAMSWL